MYLMKTNSIGSTHSVHSADSSDEASGPSSWHPEVPELTSQERVNPWFQALSLSPPRAHTWEPSKKPERRLAFSLSTNEAASSSTASKSSVNKEMKIEDSARKIAQRQFELHKGAPIPEETIKQFKKGHYSSEDLRNL
ncbi:hypothetical protein [Xanthomonas arboricola]|uniref:hypothetical protein n=2 Tax=Xanthomonas arboricola TaxID=56448 RepID=UPI0011AFF909|nr:hypothetical protein [Xanthomonas arboricola]